MAGLILQALALPASAADAQGEKTINLLYNERPPLHYTDADGTVKGLLAAPAEKALKSAGIPFRWQRRPVARIMFTIKENVAPDCAVGWYKSPEREAFSRYSLPIYSEAPSVALVRADYDVPQGITARQLLLSTDTKLLLKLGMNYGVDLNDMLAQVPKNRIQVVTEEVPTMVKMVSYKRADLTFLTREEADEVIKQSGIGPEKFKILDFPDHPHGELRYILCSLSVAPETMVKLDAAIKTLSSAAPSHN